ncbi:MAG: hypothetical protein GY790_18110 [Bacteroidetes bacterium]|nr:hypothetical protein [Bacteroidota bacterium]
MTKKQFPVPSAEMHPMEYEELRRFCKLSSRISKHVVDDFLINYAAGHQGMEKKMEQHFDRFRHVGKQLGRENVNMLKSQYLAHRVFRKDGLLGKFLKHPALGRFKGEERDYLEQAGKMPWRFSFSVTVDEPAADFYFMEDVLTGKQYLLHSPGISDIRESGNPALWFNLVGFNGFCWQSYGPIVYYNSFEVGDIWFYATELNPGLEDYEEVAAHVELDPVPYMMLISGSTLPMNFNKEDQLLYLLSEFDMDKLDTARLKKEFRTEYESGVYRITNKQWEEHPHFAQIYFDEGKHILLFFAMTQRGFEALVKAFNAFGYEYPTEPYLQINLSMVSIVDKILKKKVVLNEYLDMFQEETDPEEDEMMEKINAFIALVMPELNEGRSPDIDQAALKTGVDPETAYSVVESVLESMGRIPGPGPKVSEKMGASGKKAAVKQKVITEPLPALSGEGLRLLSKDDKLLFNLHLYMMARDICSEAPWEYIFEDEVFGVQVPGSDLVYFVSVMGADEEFPSLAFYKGYEGLMGFLEFREEVERLTHQGYTSESMMRISTMPGGMLCIPQMMLSFTDREEVGKEDLAAIKKSGVRFRGKGNWPQIEEIVPGYMPVYPGRESLVELFLVMQQVLVVLNGDLEDPPEECYPVRVPSGKGPKFRWKEQYLLLDPDWGTSSYSVIISDDDRAALSSLPEASQELQIDLILLPAPVREKGSKAYFPFVLLLMDKYNGMILSSSILSPVPDLKSMYESVPQKVVEEILKLGHRPALIEIRSDLLLILLDTVMESAGCLMYQVDEMPEMDEAIDSMISGRY